MTSNPKANGDSIQGVIDGREDHAADATFSGMSLAQFKAKVKPSLDARAEIANLDRQRAGFRVDRDNADVTSLETRPGRGELGQG